MITTHIFVGTDLRGDSYWSCWRPTINRGRFMPPTGQFFSSHFGKCSLQPWQNGWHSCSLPPWVEGTLSVTILLLAGSGSLAARTWPATVAGLPAIWKVCCEVVMLPATVEAARHTTPPRVTCTRRRATKTANLQLRCPLWGPGPQKERNTKVIWFDLLIFKKKNLFQMSCFDTAAWMLCLYVVVFSLGRWCWKAISLYHRLQCQIKSFIRMT